MRTDISEKGLETLIFDDLVAAFCTLLVIALWRLWF